MAREKAKVNFKIYDVIDCTTDNENTHIAQFIENQNQSEIKPFLQRSSS